MDIYTGDVVAMVSSPTFNPNKFVHGISQKDWNILTADSKKPLINKSIAEKDDILQPDRFSKKKTK